MMAMFTMVAVIIRGITANGACKQSAEKRW